jgi:glycosyltransferase involved in cell wall biosynthesis
MKYKHTFAICAYKESPYLEECIRSVENQTVKSEVILVTSTPCEYIENICAQHNIPYYVNCGESGITQDWNFAYAKSKTPIVTITHQDDIYFETYTETLLTKAKKAKQPLIFFTDYCELRDGRLVRKNRLLNIKRVMLFPLRATVFQRSIFVRRRILSLGSPICCPSVAYFKENLPEVVFLNHFRTNEDWEAWERISRRKGQFLYVCEPLMAHRIHKDSETTAAIQETGRTGEDIEMYKKFWPKPIAVALSKLYKKSEASNEV